MGYRSRIFGLSTVLSLVLLAGMIYLLLSSMIAMSLMPVVGAGGLFVGADTLQADQGIVYPEMQRDNVDYDQEIGTSTPECPDGIPMLAIELQGEAQALGFFFKKDVQIPFIQDRFMSIEVGDPDDPTDRIAISGDNLILFTSQFGGDSLLLRNVDVQEGTFASGEKWGRQSDEFILRGGEETSETVPGIEATNLAAWLHGATGDRVTLEPESMDGTISVDVSYPSTEELEDFYIEDERFGFDLGDDNPEFERIVNPEERTHRGIVQGDEGYFPCDPDDIPVE